MLTMDLIGNRRLDSRTTPSFQCLLRGRTQPSLQLPQQEFDVLEANIYTRPDPLMPVDELTRGEMFHKQRKSSRRPAEFKHTIPTNVNRWINKAVYEIDRGMLTVKELQQYRDRVEGILESSPGIYDKPAVLKKLSYISKSATGMPTKSRSDIEDMRRNDALESERFRHRRDIEDQYREFISEDDGRYMHDSGPERGLYDLSVKDDIVDAHGDLTLYGKILEGYVLMHNPDMTIKTTLSSGRSKMNNVLELFRSDRGDDYVIELDARTMVPVLKHKSQVIYGINRQLEEDEFKD